MHTARLVSYPVIGEVSPYDQNGEYDMAKFTNYATLTYNGGSTDSNTVTGELVEILTANKTAIGADYTAKGTITYGLSLVNSGSVPLNGLTVTDQLGGYLFNAETVYPLAYVENSIRCYVNGVLQTTPIVETETPLVIRDITVPAGGNTILLYETAVTAYAPLGADATIVNQASITGAGLADPLTAEATVAMERRADLNISKALCPTSVTENGSLTYTFVIENSGGLAATATDSVVLSDTFSPRLRSLVVTFDGTVWTEGEQYTYDPVTGVFSTVAGQITVPAAEYEQNANGIWTVEPGSVTLTVSGTV